MASTYIPAIAAVSLSPNPALVGETVLVSVVAVDVEIVPKVLGITAGQVTAGVIV